MILGGTGKFFSEALILASPNPQYENLKKTYAVLEVWVKAQQQTPAIMTVKTMKIATIAGVDLKGAKKYSPPSFSMVKFLY